MDIGNEEGIERLSVIGEGKDDRCDFPHVPGSDVNTAAIQEEVMRTCGHLPRSVREEVYAERVFQERYFPDNNPE